MLRTILITIGGLLILPASALAQCPSTVENPTNDGSAVFGLRWDDKRISDGQGFLVPCRSNFDGASFELHLDEGAETLGRRELTVGDDLIAELLDRDFNVLALVSTLIDWADGTKVVSFDFSDQDILLDPGEYYVALRTTADGVGSILFDPAGTFADGNRIVRFDEDEWRASGDDLRFGVSLTPDENAVTTEAASFSNVKALYR